MRITESACLRGTIVTYPLSRAVIRTGILFMLVQFWTFCRTWCFFCSALLYVTRIQYICYVYYLFYHFIYLLFYPIFIMLHLVFISEKFKVAIICKNIKRVQRRIFIPTFSRRNKFLCECISTQTVRSTRNWRSGRNWFWWYPLL